MSSDPMQNQDGLPVDQNLWRIHGLDYDLSSFARLHPGGEVAVDLGKGLDCTKLFDSYHLMTEVHKHVLGKYACNGQAKIVHLSQAHDSSPARSSKLVTLPVSAFQADLKELLWQHFKRPKAGLSHKAKTSHSLLMGAVVGMYAIAWLGWIHGSYCALLVLPFLAWLVMANMAHDGSHFAVSNHPVVNALCLYASSPLYYTDSTWYMQHVVSHHLETNDYSADVDLHHHKDVRWHPQKPKDNDLQGWKNVLLHLTAFLAATFMLAVVQPFNKFIVPGVCQHLGLNAPNLYGASTVFEKVIDRQIIVGFATVRRLIVNTLLWVWAVAVLLYPAWLYGPFSRKAILFSVYPYIVSGTLFMIVTQISHIQKETQTNAAITEKDFFKRQAMTSLDYSCNSLLWSFLTGGLNMQSLHHVAPIIHSSHYVDLYPQYYKLCVKHGCAPPQAPNVMVAVKKHFAYIFALGEGYTLPTPEM
eukprot:TRINITY_DN73605_c0_g1_i1.p1 TRINITY_DN73605_c0_g1~~TRINITY_DN73605_c0_g1_i1.p1  ORF type:complete len:472 (-),score=43.83 TRINITY_DN73605_c0_g1_i1:453-1868(-)